MVSTYGARGGEGVVVYKYGFLRQHLRSPINRGDRGMGGRKEEVDRTRCWNAETAAR